MVEVGPGEGLYEAELRFRVALVRAVLKQCDGNRTKAARRLKLQRTYLLRLIRQLELDRRPDDLAVGMEP